MILLLIASCTDETNNGKILNFKVKNNNKFNDIFELKEVYDIPSLLSQNIKLLGIDKIFATPNGNFIIYDMNSGYLLLTTKKGDIIKIIGKKGKGPGEFALLSDVIFTNEAKLYALDFIRQEVLYYQDFEFVRNYKLSYVHRNPTQIIKIPNSKFIIAAERNLEDGASETRYRFLPYKEVNFLNIYDSNFVFRKSFLKPDERLIETEGVLTRVRLTTFVPSCLIEDKIISTTQEGLYNLYIHDLDGNLINEFSIVQENFKYLDLNLINEYNLNKNNFNNDLETIGKIMASYSAPISIFNLNGILLITILEPYDNYFPMFSTNELNLHEYHLDIFKYKNDNLFPMIGGIAINKKIIGVADGEYLYMIDKKYEENKEIIRIYKYKLKL